MKTAKIFKELLIGSIVVAPLLYYFYLWKFLPNEIPIHFDTQGNPNNYGSKFNVGLTLLFLSIGTYLLLRYIPKIDPKKNFSIFDNTFVKLRFILSLFFSATCFIIIFSVKEGELNTSHFYIAFAILIALMGNYMSNIRPNYFLGIRTPWALESEMNWKKTHFVTGRLWFVSGIVLVVFVLLLPQNRAATIASVTQLWNKLYPQEEYHYRFLDDRFNEAYKADNNFGKVYLALSLLTIFIASLGLFALAKFASKARIKEIGIRKVNGARTGEVMAMLNRDFIRWVAISFFIAMPVAYYTMHKWLENFAYKTNLSWWIFVLAGLLALGIALLTVCWQSWKAATRNPVEALRYE